MTVKDGVLTEIKSMDKVTEEGMAKTRYVFKKRNEEQMEWIREMTNRIKGEKTEFKCPVGCMLDNCSSKGYGLTCRTCIHRQEIEKAVPEGGGKL